MISLRLCLLFLLTCGLASCTQTTINESEKPLKLSPSVALTDENNNPAKRDSSDQTASHNAKPKDEPFKPMLSVPYPEQPFRSGGIRYAGAEAAPQVYYEKLDRTGGVQYAPQVRSQSVSANGGILYAPTRSANGAKESSQYSSNAYRGPLSPTYQQVSHVAAVQQYERGSAPTVSAPPSIVHHQQQQQHHAQQIFFERDSEPEFMFGQVVQQQPSPQIVSPKAPSPSRSPSLPLQHPKQQQKQVQYVIAIPVEYMQQLQHHLGAISTHVPPSPTLSTQVPESPGKIYQGIYKPLHYTSSTPTEAPLPPNSPADYTTQYIQVPESLLQSLGAPIYNKSKYQQTYYPQHQPAAQHQRQQQQHQQQQQQQHQQQLQQSTVYAYPFHQQQEQYQQQHRQQQPQLEQQHQQQPQQQPQAQQQPLQPIVRIGVAKASSSQATAAHHLTAPSVVQPPIPTPQFIHYKPIYVQQQQQYQQGQQQLPMSFAHYHQHHLAASPYFIRQAYVPAAAGNIYPQFESPLQQSIAPKMSFGYPYPPLQPEAADIAYFSHPGAVHYGTHLFHPPTQATPNQVLGPVATAATHQIHHQQQQQQQQQLQHAQQQQLPQQHQQQQKQYTPAAGSHSPSRAPGAALVKYT